jgi:hypothetical protein
MRGLGVVIIKGAKTIVECNEKIYFHYFEKSTAIVFNNSLFFFFVIMFFHSEVENNFIMLKEYFYIQK